MKEVTEIFDKEFMLTGESYDPKDLDFTFYTHEKMILNPDQTPSVKEYYMNYDSGTGTFSDMAVKCVYTYETDPIEIRTEDIEWYFEDGTVGTTRQLVQVNETE